MFRRGRYSCLTASSNFVRHAPGRRTCAVHHHYDADTGGTIRMQVREIEWEDGWPVSSYGPGDGEPTG